MSEKQIKMRKYYDRDSFTYEEKVDICRKTDEVCSHCGKKMYIGYGATVDHFIPLNKGGSNRMINLIPLCKECNEAKEDKLYNLSYVPYLKDKYKKELAQYLDSYVSVMDYVQRHRILAYDEYEDYLLIRPLQNKKTRKAVNGIKSSYKIKLATWNDLDKIHEYLVKYLKKLNCLDNEDVARENITFWLKFGCIYYIERNNEIVVMTALTIRQMEDDEYFRGVSHQPYMYIFPYYNTDISYNIVKNLISNIPIRMMEENNLEFIPINILFLEEERLQFSLSQALNLKIYNDIVNGFNIIKVVVSDNALKNEEKALDEMNPSELKTYHFFRKFDDVTNKLIEYFSEYEDKSQVGWMINSLLSTTTIKSTQLQNYIKFEE